MNNKNRSRGARMVVMALETENCNIDACMPNENVGSNEIQNRSTKNAIKNQIARVDFEIPSQNLQSTSREIEHDPENELFNLHSLQNVDSVVFDETLELIETSKRIIVNASEAFVPNENVGSNEIQNRRTENTIENQIAIVDFEIPSQNLPSTSNSREIEHDPENELLNLHTLVNVSEESTRFVEFEEDSDCSVRDPDYQSETDSEATDRGINSSGSDAEDAQVSAPINGNANGEKKRSRWKKNDPSKWKKQLLKKQRIEAKQPKPVDCEKCRYHCSRTFSEDVRTALCKNFWESDYLKQKEFLLGNTERTKPTRRRIRMEGSTRERKYSMILYFNTESQKVRVCKQFFIRTLCISADMIDTAYKGKGEGKMFVGEDQRGKRTPHNKTDPESLKRVKDHIEKFPTLESHYSRKDTKRLYLDSQLSITKMYCLYKEDCMQDNSKPVSEITYRRVFCNDYNLSFYKPKKDQCQLCTRYNSLKNVEEKQALEEDYQQHVRRKEECNQAKAIDKERCQADQTFMCCTFDLQSVLQIPSSDVSSMYYSLKVCMYNFTIYELCNPNDAFCYGWNELHGKRGSSEIGSCLLKYILELKPEIKQLCFFSDTCGGQNRNQNIAALFLYLAQVTNLDTIEHKFLESGHTFMEVDSMHSAIETAKKYVPVYTIQDWLNIFRIARSKRVRNKKSPNYKVCQMFFKDFKDLNELSKCLIKNRAKNSEGQQVNWLKVKCFKYQKCKPGIIQYRYDHSSEYKEIHVFGKGRPKTFHDNISLKDLYSKILPITAKKKNSLLQLCRKGDIPEEYHGWYKSLPTSKAAVDQIPATDSDEDDHD